MCPPSFPTLPLLLLLGAARTPAAKQQAPTYGLEARAASLRRASNPLRRAPDCATWRPHSKRASAALKFLTFFLLAHCAACSTALKVASEIARNSCDMCCYYYLDRLSACSLISPLALSLSLSLSLSHSPSPKQWHERKRAPPQCRRNMFSCPKRDHCARPEIGRHALAGARARASEWAPRRRSPTCATSH